MQCMPKFVILKPIVDSGKMSAEDQKVFWSGVRMLLYLINHLRSDIANVTQEMPKVNDGAYPSAFYEVLHVIKHILDAKKLRLKLEPSRNASKLWEIVCFSDSDYAGDPISRKNISGLILYVLGVSVSW